MNNYYLIIFAAFLSYGLNCPSSITVSPVFSSDQCIFRYKMDNSSCLFQKCNYGSRTIGWKECINECCAQTDFERFDNNIDLVYQCQEDNKQKKKLVLGLSIGLSFSSIALIIVIVICFKNEKCLFYKLKERMANPKQPQIVNPVKPTNELVNIELNSVGSFGQDKTEIAIKRQNESKLWNSNITKNMRLMQAKCAICKAIKPQSWLPCDHYVHIECIGTWLAKHKNLCFCKNDLKFIHLFCTECRQDLKVLSIKTFSSSFKKGKKFNCEKCKVSPS